MKSALSVLLLLFLVACGAPPQPPTRVTVNPWVGYDPLVLARERGLLDPDQIKVVELMSNSESLRAMRNGLTEAAALTLDEALRLADEGVPIRIAAILDVSHGADAVLASPDIMTPAQLKGRRIALEETALGALVLDRLLAAGGLTDRDVETQHSEAAMHEAVLKGGRTDAVITFEPMKSRLVAQGYRVVFDSRRMPGEIVDVLVVRTDLPAARTQALLAAWDAGRRALLADPLAAAAILAPGVGLSPKAYLATLDGLQLMSPADSAARLAPAAMARDAGSLAAKLQALGLIRSAPDWSRLLAAPPEARP